MKIARFIMGLIGLLLLAVVVGAFNAATGAGIVTAVVFAGFTEEQSKSFSDFIEKQSTDIQGKVKSLVDGIKDTDLIKGIQALISGEKGLVGNVAIMQKQLDEIATEQAKAKKAGTKSDEFMTLPQAIKSIIDSPEFKAAKADGFRKDSTFQVKANAITVTGDVNRTALKPTPGFATDRAQAFIPHTNAMFVGQDKNRIGWIEAAYTSLVGYVGEGVGQTGKDSGTATEKFRELAKISALLPLTGENLEDFEYLASAFRVKMQTRAMLFTDLEVYAGDGNDSTQAKHIYGIKGHATAFSAAVAGVALKVVKPNIKDLIDACVLQAKKSEQRGLNVVWMNPTDLFLASKVKDLNGNYIFTNMGDGTFTVSGLTIVDSSAVTANTMTIADTSKIQLHWKRNPEIKFGQNGTDMIDDAYTAVMFLRAQLVVEGQDKTALIHVADIAASITAITAA